MGDILLHNIIFIRLLLKSLNYFAAYSNVGETSDDDYSSIAASLVGTEAAFANAAFKLVSRKVTNRRNILCYKIRCMFISYSISVSGSQEKSDTGHAKGL